MRITEKGTNIAITETVREYLYKKLSHLEKYIDPSDESVNCLVELGQTTTHHKHGNLFRTEINLHLKGKELRAVSEMSDLYSSIDLAKDEMARELQSNKDRRVSAVRRSGARVKNFLRGIFTREE